MNLHIFDSGPPAAAQSLERMAGTTGLEPATSDVTGRRSNQLNYVPAWASLRFLQNNTPAPSRTKSFLLF